MRTNIELDDKLVQQAMKLAGAKTKREAVHAALKEYVQSQRRIAAMKEMFGSDGIDPNYNYKAARTGHAR
ncbi:MAG: type II toxin-antitoxin system VapB family antitoxin [Gammaproteobacteria bacterium]|nr:type II toxin-antitoxin system VapB family antitoxin [Gammaproteobacteria bacterium]